MSGEKLFADLCRMILGDVPLHNAALFELLWRSAEGRASVQARAVKQQAPGRLFPSLPVSDEFYFLHIPKTAGTSTNQFLKSLLPPGELLQMSTWDDWFTAGANGRSLQARVYSGHFHLELEPFLKREMTRMVMLRDPVERTISHYVHVKAHPAHPFHDLAQSLSLRDFCLHPQTRHMVENYQSRYLVDFGLAPQVLSGLFTADDFVRYSLQILMEQATAGVLDEATLFATARANLARCAAVGVSEQVAASMERFARVLGVSGAPPFDEKHNLAAGAHPELDRATLVVIQEATRVDAELYSLASKSL